MLTNEKSLKNVSLAEIEGAVSLAQSANCESLANNITICGGTKQAKADRMNELANSVRSGNIESFDELYNLASPKAISIAIKMGATEDQAFDIAQEAMLRLYRNIEKVYAVSSWLNTTVSRMVIDKYRQNLKKKEFEVYELDAPMDNSEGNSKLKSETIADTRISVNPDAQLESIIKAEILKEAFPLILPMLSDRHQTIIRYALIERKQQDEIADIMKISRSTVAVHLKNAKASFRKKFAAHYDLELFGLKSAYELETNAVSSSFLIFNAELCSALFFCFFSKNHKHFPFSFVYTSVTTKHNTKRNAFSLKRKDF